MKLSFSNIAWTREEDEEALALLRDAGAQGVEIAPTVLWGEWQNMRLETLRAYRRRLQDQFGFEIPALQAILFGKTHLSLFDPGAEAELLEHFEKLGEIAQALGAKVLIFGAPKNRFRGPLSHSLAWDAAIERFQRLSQVCQRHGVVIGLEPNPVEYRCDFVTNVEDAVRLVKEVGSPSFQLHLDLGAIQMFEGSAEEVLKKHLSQSAHLHLSRPFLGPFEEPMRIDQEASKFLKESAYQGWISIEMKRQSGLESVREAISFFRANYT